MKLTVKQLKSLIKEELTNSKDGDLAGELATSIYINVFENAVDNLGDIDERAQEIIEELPEESIGELASKAGNRVFEREVLNKAHNDLEALFKTVLAKVVEKAANR